MQVKFLKDWMNKKAGETHDIGNGVADMLIVKRYAIPVELNGFKLSAQAMGVLDTYETTSVIPQIEKRKQGRPRKVTA